MTEQELQNRKMIAEMLLSDGINEVDLQMHPEMELLPAEAALTADLAIEFPEGLAPVPTPPDSNTKTTDPLPKVDVVAVTWTVDEHNALADVLTPKFGRNTWTRYNRRFDSFYVPLIRRGAPALAARRLGSWCLTNIGQKSVLCFKSELHLNQDGIADGVAPGVATLPVKDLFRQIIDEAQPELVITVGTSGGVFKNHDLGDVAVTRAAKFRCRKEFKNADFNHGKIFKSEWEIPRKHFKTAVGLMQKFADKLKEPPIQGPTVRHTGGPLKSPVYKPDIKLVSKTKSVFRSNPSEDLIERLR